MADQGVVQAGFLLFNGRSCNAGSRDPLLNAATRRASEQHFVTFALVNGPGGDSMVQLLSMKIASFQTSPNVSVGYQDATGSLDVGQEIEWDAQHLALSAWTEHVPFAFWIVKTLRPDCLVELGTERGVSYAAFCQAVERLGLGSRCFAVDTWQGDDHAGHYDESVYSRLAELNDRRYRGFSALLRTTGVNQS